jgi:hypothetical protein
MIRRVAGSHRGLLASTALCIALLAPRPALAQSGAPRTEGAGDASRVDDAARAFAAGSAAFEQHRVGDALQQFRRAHTLAPHDRVRFNIAVCLEALGRFREAAIEYDVVSSSPQLDAGIRERARAAAQGARARLATLVLSSPIPDLEVDIDGAAGCTVPCELEVDPGEHVVGYRRGEQREERRVRAIAGARLSMALGMTALATPTAAESDRASSAERGSTIDLGPLGAIGIGVAIVGTAGTIGFGVRASDVYAQYRLDGCGATAPCADGELARDLANGSIAVLLAGAIALLIDLAFIDE